MQTSGNLDIEPLAGLEILHLLPNSPILHKEGPSQSLGTSNPGAELFGATVIKDESVWAGYLGSNTVLCRLHTPRDSSAAHPRRIRTKHAKLVLSGRRNTRD